MGITEIILIIAILTLIAGNSAYFFQLKDDKKRRSFFDSIHYIEILGNQKKIKGLNFLSKFFNWSFHILVIFYVIPEFFAFYWFESGNQMIILFQIAIILLYGVSALFFPQILVFKLYEKLRDFGKFN